ncbi:pirin family protein [Variovorax ginsengisoli]|uniref:Pirin family protein n=1 Tax=Variovorax ginsengisoli TaxID=363844 RepID=A0ABT8S4E0_9BURK|nr:pirin family protein [Variovorax ginsengisoli]MDN8614606.1 pirin family protein [Variovorax ginsengisoli]MDO1533776.1 pirin family protein [Variovorax ginsengisoli]
MTAPLLLQPHDKDLGGGFKVRRLLPAAKQRSVGPFVFFDHFGPATETPGSEHDVRPHPHIGLATVTYLFEGAMMHRDSLGSVQEIRPGAINWMTAGRGIVHSERKPDTLRDATYVNHGLQLWVALPQAHEEVEPSFVHTAAADIPALEVQGVPVRVLVGEAFGVRSPVTTLSQTVYLDVALPAGGRFELPALARELAVYPVDGDITLDGEPVAQHQMAMLAEGQGGVLAAQGAVRLVVIGGEPLDGPRFITWNFVSSRRERILEAGADWAAQRMGQVPGETEFIPLPGHPFQVQQAADSGTTPV